MSKSIGIMTMDFVRQYIPKAPRMPLFGLQIKCYPSDSRVR